MITAKLSLAIRARAANYALEKASGARPALSAQKSNAEKYIPVLNAEDLAIDNLLMSFHPGKTQALEYSLRTQIIELDSAKYCRPEMIDFELPYRGFEKFFGKTNSASD